MAGQYQATGENVWLITGAASGLGASIVEAAVVRGDKVIATARPAFKEKLRIVIDSLPPKDRERIRVLYLDITDTAENTRNIMKTAIGLWGRIDVLVNNAGVAIGGVTEEEGVDAFLKQFQTNVFGVINVTNAILPYMRERRDGTIVIIRAVLLGLVFPVLRNVRLQKQLFTLAEFTQKRVIENPAVGDLRKGMEILVDVVRGERRAVGRAWPSLLFLGAEARDQIRAKSAMWERDLQAWSDVCCDVTNDLFPSNSLLVADIRSTSISDTDYSILEARTSRTILDTADMSNDQTAAQKVWLITGAGSGLGASLAGAVLARGDKVIITGRPGSKEKMQGMVDALPDNERDESRIRLLELDVTDTTENIRLIMKTAVDFWGRIDVLVNNAGIVVPGITEEQGVQGWERQFRTNVFGVINVTNAVLPYMRARRDGNVVILGSRSAWKNDFPGIGPYSASKAAIHSYADTLSAEVGTFNIRVLNLAPAAFRTSGFDPPKPIVDHIDDYDPIRQQMAAIVKERRERSSFGDPRKGMEIVVDVVRGEGRAAGREWSSLLFLGGDALVHIREKMHKWEHDLEAWSDVAQDVTEDK
ncbi:hypothetical protein EVG20_g4054 [Dentipellis fragilis]|uniref:Ketoreductase domain-containing protein n=1 Tax=Dentipellis fragilis TaxID=205917 RepID=A0A4Y9YXP2_9AGAM|nr:hypothetical protein EVG20_g4054 [Dentipellis fragilis]